MQTDLLSSFPSCVDAARYPRLRRIGMPAVMVALLGAVLLSSRWDPDPFETTSLATKSHARAW